MKKKSMFILGIILVATLVSAQVAFNLSDAKFTPEPKGAITLNAGNVTFDCDKTPMIVWVSSGDAKIEDDFEQVIGSACTLEVTNVVDWNDRTYKQNEYGLRSFNEDVLKKDVCGKNEQNYNATSKECYENEVEVGFGESESQIMYECIEDGDLEICPGGLSGGLGTRCYLTIDKDTWNNCAGGWILQ